MKKLRKLCGQLCSFALVASSVALVAVFGNHLAPRLAVETKKTLHLGSNLLVARIRICRDRRRSRNCAGRKRGRFIPRAKLRKARISSRRNVAINGDSNSAVISFRLIVVQQSDQIVPRKGGRRSSSRQGVSLAGNSGALHGAAVANQRIRVICRRNVKRRGSSRVALRVAGNLFNGQRLALVQSSKRLFQNLAGATSNFLSWTTRRRSRSKRSLLQRLSRR